MLTVPENLTDIMRDRYYQPDETTPQQMIKRVVEFVANGERQYGWSDAQIQVLAKRYFDTINQRLWMPSSPFLMNAGTKVPMLSACFVIGGLEDNLDSIFDTLKRTANVWKMGGGTGFNFSVLREEGAPIRSTGGTSSGVMSWMDIYNAAGDSVKQGGRRRVANIGVLNYNHPEIMKFIDYKTDHNKLTNFNISVLVDDDFMQKAINREDYDLISPATGEVVGRLNAGEVFDKIMENNWKSAEPALLFRDNINRNNPMKHYLGDIVSTNPCGEIVLYEDEACNLASINLEQFVDWEGNVDYDKLKEVTRLVVRFLDTSIDVNQFPDERIARQVKKLRRLGVGIMGLHGALIKMGYKYSSSEGRTAAEQLMKFINNTAHEASKELAKEKGIFPLWAHSSYKEEMRNVALTCIAPTGTISQIINSSSSGAEPIFALTYKRLQLLKDGTQQEVFWVNPIFEEIAKREGFWTDDLPAKIYENKGSAKGVKEIPLKYQELFETAMEISPEAHVRMQAALQKYVDNSISKTINLPASATVEDIREAYILGWKLGLKGMTVYRDGSRFGQVLSVGNDKVEEGEADCSECICTTCSFQETTCDVCALCNEVEDSAVQECEFYECAPIMEHEEFANLLGIALKRGEIVKAPMVSSDSKTVKLTSGCGSMYLTMTKNANGEIDQTFVARGSSGTCLSNQTAVSRLISLALRGGISVEHIADQLMSVPACVSYCTARAKGKPVSAGASCPTAIALELLKYAEEGSKMALEFGVVKDDKKPVPEKKKEETIELGVPKGACPKCGTALTVAEGCMTCYNCGYSKCS